MRKFQSSVLRGGSLIRPQVITIDNNSIMIEQKTPTLISTNKQKIRFSNIAGIHLKSNFYVSSIIIETVGGSTVSIENLDPDDAKEIERLLS